MTPRTNLLRSYPDYARLAHVPVAQDPYPHFLVRGFLSSESVAAVVAGFPTLEMGGLFLPDQARGALVELIEEMEGE